MAKYKIEDPLTLTTGVPGRQLSGGRWRPKPIEGVGPIPFRVYLHYRNRLFVESWNGWSPRTRKIRRDGVEQFEMFLRGRAITRPLVSQWCTELAGRYSENWTKAVMAGPGRVFQVMEDEQIIRRSPMVGLIRAHGTAAQEKAAYSQEDFQRLYATASKAKTRFREDVMLAISLMHYCGLARVDMAVLTWRQVDMERMIITGKRQKTETPFVIPFMAGTELDQCLRRAREGRPETDDVYPNKPERGDQNYVLPEFAQHFLEDRQASTADAINRACGETVQTHAFRRGFCSRMVATGMNQISIMHMTGHSSPDELAEYVKLDSEQLRGIVEAAHRSGINQADEINFRPTPDPEPARVPDAGQGANQERDPDAGPNQPGDSGSVGAPDREDPVAGWPDVMGVGPDHAPGPGSISCWLRDHAKEHVGPDPVPGAVKPEVAPDAPPVGPGAQDAEANLR